MLALLREERGATIVIVALSMTVMLGFASLVVDIGNLYLNKARLDNMADAAALAGVQDLPGNTSVAVSTARSYAARNGMSGDVVGVTLSQNNTAITVNATRSVPFFFAQIFNMQSANVTAKATASLSTVSGSSGIVPFGIVQQQFVYGQTYTLKNGAGSGYSGNYAALALGGSGSPIYQNNIKQGYNSMLYIGDWVSTEPGNMSGPTSEGVGYRVGLDPTATFATVAENSARIVIVPIIGSLTVTGRSDVQIVGFAAFFLEGTGGSGSNNYVTGEFMQLVTPSTTTSVAATNYGLYSSRLVE